MFDIHVLQRFLVIDKFQLLQYLEDFFSLTIVISIPYKFSHIGYSSKHAALVYTAVPPYGLCVHEYTFVRASFLNKRNPSISYSSFLSNSQNLVSAKNYIYICHFQVNIISDIIDTFM